MTNGQNNICWRPDWHRPFDSIWCLLVKARHLNAATGTDIRDIFKRGHNYAIPQRRPYLRRDLNSLIEVDENKVVELLTLDRTHIANATSGLHTARRNTAIDE